MTDLLPPAQLGRSGRLESVLASLLSTAPELEAAAVVSFDGLPMASALPDGMDEDRVAAMSAALLSLGDRAAQGLGRGDLSQVYVEGRHGTVFLVSADDEAVLVAVAASRAKVGLMLFEVRRAAEAVAAALVADDLDTAIDPFVAPRTPTAATSADHQDATDIDALDEVEEVHEVHDAEAAAYQPDPILDAVLAPAPVPAAPPVPPPPAPPAPPVGYPAAAYPPPPPYIPAPPPAAPVQVPVAPPAAVVRPVTVPPTGPDGRAWQQSPVVEQGWA